jgi:hypothetical protein
MGGVELTTKLKLMSILQRMARSIRGPKCHLEPAEKEWIERRLVWLRGQFGPEPIRRAPLEPGSNLLPSRWDGSPEAGADLLLRLCRFMRVDSARLRLEVYSETESHAVDSSRAGEVTRSGPAGLFIPPEEGGLMVIGVEETGLQRPASLAATLCHELGHVHLLGDRRIAREEEDGEPLTDLLTVYFGVGIFTANAVIQFSQWQDGRMQGWSASRQGYLSEAQFGYALACHAWLRGDLKAPWRRHLRENIAYYFEDSMHFLETTRETTLAFDGA